MNPTVYRASPIYVLFMTLLFIAAAYGCYWLASSGYIVTGEFRRSLRFLNVVPADIKIFACYFGTGFFAFTAFAIGRFLLDDKLVLIDDKSIEVRYALWSKKAYWEDFKAIKPVLGGLHLKFSTDPRTVEFPTLRHSPGRKELTLDVLGRLIDPEDAVEAEAGGNVFIGQAAAAPAPAVVAPATTASPFGRTRSEEPRRAFGKRTAA